MRGDGGHNRRWVLASVVVQVMLAEHGIAVEHDRTIVQQDPGRENDRLVAAPAGSGVPGLVELNLIVVRLPAARAAIDYGGSHPAQGGTPLRFPPAGSRVTQASRES